MFHYEFYIHKQCICNTKNVKHEFYLLSFYEAEAQGVFYKKDDSELLQMAWQEAIEVSYFGPNSSSSAFGSSAAGRFLCLQPLMRSFKRTVEQFVSIKNRDSLHKLHIQAFMHRRKKVFNNRRYVFDIFRALSQGTLKPITEPFLERSFKKVNN